MSAYLHSLSIVATADAAATVRSLFAQFEGGEAGAALAARLSTTGLEPATHFGAHTVVTESTRTALVALRGSGSLPSGVDYLIVPNGLAGTVRGSSVAGLAVTDRSTFLTLLAARGLKLIPPAVRAR